jgi:signal transduction histidine kinase
VPWIRVAARAEMGGRGPAVSITVEDRGLGIAPEDLPHVFEPFYRGQEAKSRKIHGSGLGLSLVRRTATAHGGRVAVESVPGRGTVFTLHLPAQPATSAELEAQANAQAHPAG